MRRAAENGDLLPVVASRTADYLALTKPGLTLLSVATAAGGAALAPSVPHHSAVVLHTVIATFLVGAGAGALNQFAERNFDGMMHRTAERPLPSGRIAPMNALVIGLVLAGLGVSYMWTFGNALSAVLGLATLISYVLVYTPLKRRTPLSTVLGGVPGALPPMIGWAMATGGLSSESWSLFFIVFCWQMPHFLSLAWIYRNEYARAGYKTLTVVDVDGSVTAIQTVLYALVLIVASILPVYVRFLGGIYFAGAAFFSVLFLITALRFALLRTNRSARHLFLASLLFLPILGIFMFLDRLWFPR